MGELIYNQRRIPEAQWRYGFRSSAKIGCGWIAAYNALCILGQEVDIPELIARFERQIPIVNGSLGTFLGSPPLILRTMGFRVHPVSRRSRFDEAARECPVCLLSYYWRRGYRVGAHYVAVRYVNGRFEGYNTFSNSVGPDVYGPSLDAFLRRRGYFAPILTQVFPQE